LNIDFGRMKILEYIYIINTLGYNFFPNTSWFNIMLTYNMDFN